MLSRPGTGLHGVPSKFTRFSMLNFSVSSFRRMARHFSTPFDVPITYSVVSSMKPTVPPRLVFPQDDRLGRLEHDAFGEMCKFWDGCMASDSFPRSFTT